ncbi:MAG: Crp/Fnr family transcriptional regulator [Bacteroidetes bacterium]|nr:Crp/Fnr family transcriptional regulator [Bacteroidota bacterium]
MNKKEQYTGCTISSNQTSCFENLTDEEKNLLEKNSVRVNYKKGETICKQGSFSTHIMFIEKGLVKVYLEEKTNTLVLKIVPSCNLLGLTSINEDFITYQYSALAYFETEIIQIDIHFFRKLLIGNAVFAREVINILNRNSVQVNGRFFCFTHKQSYGRMADIIICLSDRVFKNTEFELLLNRNEIAELSGMSTETVVRLLRKFKDDGLIETGNKYLKILDYDRLKIISEHG